MKKYKSAFPALLVLFIIVSNSRYARGQVHGVWSGTVSMIIRSESMTGTGETHINTSFTDNKGYGTIKYEAAGKLIPGTGACEGKGVAELHDVTFEADNTYRIYVIGPECSDGPNPNSNHQNDIEIADEPFTGNPTHLSGTKKIEKKLDENGGTATITLTWDLIRIIDVKLIVTPINYDTWLPEPGRDEYTKGSVINISLKLLGRYGRAPTLKAKSFELQLSNTSKEPGITINAPLVPIDNMPDLWFLPQAYASVSDSFQFAEIECRNGVSGDISIGAFDGGGYTTLTAIAILEDDTRVIGELLIPGGEKEILIPKRKPGSKIATAWLIANGNPIDTADHEISSGNIFKGDGLSAYEEYRGVISEGKFRRLDPNKKELGVRMKKNDFPLFSLGLTWFENATSLKIVRFDTTEIGLDRRLNKNASTAHVYDQYALKLRKANLPYGVGGQAFNYGGPKTTTLVAIDWVQIQKFYQKFVREAAPARLLYTQAELLANTVAHELSHGVNVKHHGKEPSEPDPQVAEETSQPPYRIFKSNGTEITKRYYILSEIGVAGSQQSGDLSCIIAYNPYHKWAFTVGADGANIFNQVPLLPMGNKMCNSINGTGINHSIIYFGDARTGGNCLSQINLKQ